MKIEVTVEKLQEDLESIIEMVEIDQLTVNITLDGETIAVLVPYSMFEALGNSDSDNWLGESDSEDDDEEDK